MVPATVFPRSDAVQSDGRDLTLRWSGRVSLTRRILAVNIIALAMLAGGFFYLDSYRSQQVDSRVARTRQEVRLAAEAIAAGRADVRDALLVRLARATGSRLRVFDRAGREVADSRVLGVRNFVLLDPDKQPAHQEVARFLDAAIDRVVGATRAPLFRERAAAGDWHDIRAALATGAPTVSVWRAPDRTPVITAAAPLPNGALLLSVNAREITRTVRNERFRLGVVLAVTFLASVLLSLFLARTIVRPLRRLARAAVRVRLGRAREVVVPRLPDRRDEIGMLARALSDMSIALRERIDATEAFAADVTHELKNPLASLRSAVDGLGRVSDPALQEQLLTVARDDVHRLDRLIGDISEASRLDAQLSRAKFETVDVGALAAGLVRHRDDRGTERGVRLRLVSPGSASLAVYGEGARLERAFDNLLDNAVSFSPDGGEVVATARAEDGWVEVAVEDVGPGVPAEEREAIFRRFHSVRPEGEAFGRHSGLGLAIARTIVEAHGGEIMVGPRADGRRGARFTVKLPAAEAA